MAWRQWLQGWRGAFLLSAFVLGVSFIDSVLIRPDYLFPPYFKHVLLICLIYSIAALSLNFVSGYIGQTSLGHAAFFGLGAFTSALLTQVLNWPFWPAFLAAGVVSAIVGLPLGAPAVRVRAVSTPLRRVVPQPRRPSSTKPATASSRAAGISHDTISPDRVTNMRPMPI